TYRVQRVGAMVATPVPWDPVALTRYEALYQALSDHLAPDRSKGGAKVPLRDHPLLDVVASWNMGLNGIRDVCQVSGQCPPLSAVPTYSREALTNGILRSTRAVVNRFPRQFIYVPFFRISDEVASPPLDRHLLQALKQEFFNGSTAPKVGLFQENVSCNGPSVQGAFALQEEQNDTYTMLQMLQTWVNPQAQGQSAGATDACLVTTVPGDRSTAISGPEVALKRSFETFGARYFEIYAADLLHDGFADEFEEWHKMVHAGASPPAVASVKNAASGDSVVASGSIASTYGSELALATASAPGLPLPTELGGTRVLLGSVAAELYYVSPNQINFVVPAGSGALIVRRAGIDSRPAALTIAPQAPGIFTMDGQPGGAAAVLHADGRLVDAAAPARRGETLLLFLTGLGTRRDVRPEVRMGAAPAEVMFYGPAPGFPGLDQINFVVPDTVPTGAALAVTISTPAGVSNAATIATGG
ncbi:MAG: hypothetical protein ACRD44_12245, partial [Bryobacteraceae bacterium]